MTLICFASQKGSPGTTAVALAVAAALRPGPGRRKLLLEADAAGGTLAIRYRLPVEPGLLTLAAAVRGGLEPPGLWRHAQELPGGLPVVVCPDGPEQVGAAMSASGGPLGRFLNGLADVDVICDVGRLGSDPPSLAFVAEAGALLMVARPTAEQLQPAARRLALLRPRLANLGWVLIGQKPYGAAEVERTYRFPVVGVIADDRRSVVALEQGAMTKRLQRHPFLRSSVTLAKTLSTWLEPVAATSAGEAGSDAVGSAQPAGQDRPRSASRNAAGRFDPAASAALQPDAAVDVEATAVDRPGPPSPVAASTTGLRGPADPGDTGGITGPLDRRAAAGSVRDDRLPERAVRPPPAFRSRASQAGAPPPSSQEAEAATSPPPPPVARPTGTRTGDRPFGAGLPGPRLPAWPPASSPARTRPAVAGSPPAPPPLPPAPPLPPRPTAGRLDADVAANRCADVGIDEAGLATPDRVSDEGDGPDERADDDPPCPFPHEDNDVDWAMR